MTLHGYTSGLKPSEKKRLEKLATRKVRPTQLISPELAREIATLSRELNRQIGILLDRKGHVAYVICGDTKKLQLPDLGRTRAGARSFRGLRLVHTHLAGEALTQDDLTDLALLKLDLVAVIHPNPEGTPTRAEFAHLLPPNDRGEMFAREAFDDFHDLPEPIDQVIAEVEAEFRKAIGSRKTGDERPRAVVVIVTFASYTSASRQDALPPVEDRIAEMNELCDTAGLHVVDTITQRRERPDPRWFIGKGKLDELLLRSMQQMADVVVFDHDLTPAQAKTIGDALDGDVLDRTQLILEIFARRATSQAGKLQVELARLKYALPRLSEKEAALSRITGGIGAQGPGETKLEILRRRARDRITRVERQIDALADERRLRRKKRERSDVPVVAIIGYTNAGKSTLLNTLTNAEVLAENRLFATLDPTSRRLRFPEEKEIILTDTVGFIRDLPPDLVKAFHSTLEELTGADLLIHLIDVSHPMFREQTAVTERVVGSLGAAETPMLRVYNKIDRLTDEELAAAFGDDGPLDGICISAARRIGLDVLLTAIEDKLWHTR